MNDQNLRSLADLPAEVHREISRKGGINSGKSRARMKIIQAIIVNMALIYIGRGDPFDIEKAVDRLMGMSDEELVQETVQLGQEPEMIELMHEMDQEVSEITDIGDLFDD